MTQSPGVRVNKYAGRRQRALAGTKIKKETEMFFFKLKTKIFPNVILKQKRNTVCQIDLT